MHIVADRVHPDEGCWGLHEGPQQRRWVQQVFVIRGDAMAKYETDFGPVEDFPNATEILYPSWGENTVAELQALAERDRHSDKWSKWLEELKGESTLIPDILRQEEQWLQEAQNRSVFGNGITVQRNAVPRVAMQRAHKEKRNARHNGS